MRKCAVLVGIAGLALASGAFAGAKKDLLGLREASGVFISATPKPGAGTFEMKVALDNEGERLFELPAQLAVAYIEKGGDKLVRLVRVVSRRVPDAKGQAHIAQGTLTKAELVGARVALSLKVGEGDAAADQVFMMASRIQIAYQEDAGRLLIQSLNPLGRREKPEKGPKQPQGVKPPENL